MSFSNSSKSFPSIPALPRFAFTFLYASAPKIDGKRNNHASKDEKEIIRIPGGIPAIIDEKLFMDIQQRMSNRKMNARNRAKEVYLLSGRIFCAKCGALMAGHTSYSGRSKTKYSAYYCGTRYRTKNCDLKPINKDYVENLAIDSLKENILNPEAIILIAEKLMVHYAKMNEESISDLKLLEEKQATIQHKINNIVNAIADGLYDSSLKDLMNRLNQERDQITNLINDIKCKGHGIELNKDLIITYLQKDMDALNEKSPDDLRRIIQTYVEKVLVDQENVQVFLVLHMNGRLSENPGKRELLLKIIKYSN